MSTIELDDPELRDALAQWPLLPLSAETLIRRRANALELIAAVPEPNLPDIATDEIHVESRGRSLSDCWRTVCVAKIAARSTMIIACQCFGAARRRSGRRPATSRR